MDLVITLLYLLFVASAFVMIVVILLQEGKGGGFGQMLGDHGQQTFGVGAKGINTFTGYTAAIFIVSALFLHILHRGEAEASPLDLLDQQTEQDQVVPTGIGQPGGAQPGGGVIPLGGTAPGAPGTGGEALKDGK